jgi:hypothetical protein
MKLARWISTAALSFVLGTFLVGTTALVQAQDQRDEARPADPDNHPEATKPSQDEPSSRPEEAKPSKQNEDKPATSKDNSKQDDAKPRTEQGGDASKGQSAEHAQGGRGGRIPDDKFRASFGRQHTFVMKRPTVVQGQPTFQYGGYSFTLVDVWPAGWAYTDQCYIDYIDGEYFLFDLAHPGVRLAIVVVL